MLIGGVLALFVRALYRRFGLSVSNRDAFSNVFPLLTISTVLIIFVVKSSLALSLGLVGALSIVRFRAAIKEPEEIVFLFFCIALGLALGAESYELAIGGIIIFTLFVIIRHYGGRNPDTPALLLTISGEASAMFDGSEEQITAAVSQTIDTYTVQRMEIENGQVQFRAVVVPDSAEQIIAMVSSIREQLPECRVSYVNLASLL
jgi:uncharacterized membrane protein YhiD involved in acid resistance